MSLLRSRDGLLEMARLQGHRSPKFQRVIEKTIGSMSPSVIDLSRAYGIRIVGAETTVTFDPSLAKRPPRGWPSGYTWEHTDGVYRHSTREAVVTEFRRKYDGEMIEFTRAPGVLLHELGHGINCGLGATIGLAEYSMSTAFVHAFLRDVSRIIRAKMEHKFSYLLQGFGLSKEACDPAAGLDETFAEVFGAIHGHTPNEDQREILFAFRNVAAHIRSKLQIPSTPSMARVPVMHP